MKRLKQIIVGMLVMIMSVTGTFFMVYAAEGTSRNVCLEVTIKKNVLFAKFDVDVYVDNIFIQTVEYGEPAELYVIMSEGVHTLTFTQKDLKSIDGVENIDVKEDCTCAIELKNHEFYIEIDKLTITTGVTDNSQYIDLETLPVDEEIAELAEERDEENETSAKIPEIEEETTLIEASESETESIVEEKSEEMATEEPETEQEIAVEPADLDTELARVPADTLEKIDMQSLAVVGEIEDLASAETIYKVQEALNARGYDCGTPDGSAGPGTQAAISAFEMDHGLTVTGTVSEALVNALGLSFSSKNAQKAVAVAMMNKYAEDVYAEDGITYDPSKFHVYGDIGKPQFYVMNAYFGDSEQVTDTVWKCNDTHMYLRQYVMTSSL